MVGAIELIALGAYRIAFHELLSYHKLQTLRRATHQTVRTEFPFVIHPYYGYVLDPRIGTANKHGFVGRENQIQSADPEKAVIAILGGSVAVSFASDDSARDVLKSQLNKVQAFQNKNIVIVNLANLAFKEPQGLLVINEILSRGGHVDALIALDGFNEIALPEAFGNVDSGISPFYPMHWRQFATESTLGVRIQVALIFSKPILRYFVTANLIWRVIDARLAKADSSFEDRRVFLGPDAEYATRRRLYMDIAAHWGRSSVLLNNIMAAQGGVYFHFLQPNQYVTGSKPLTEHENEVAISPTSPFREPVEIGYPYLRAMGESLRNAGVWFEDLTAVFADVDQEVYVDNCCHINKEGNVILAKAIAAALTSRLSNSTGSAVRSLAFNQVNFGDSLFAGDHLRKFAPNSPDYRDGSYERIGPAKNKEGVGTALSPSTN